MGSCISTPSRLVGVVSKKSYYNTSKTKRKLHASFDHEAARKSMNLRVTNGKVLKDSLGDNILERYELGKELGRGEFGVTHQCFDLVTGEAYACKKISKAKLRSEIDVEDVRREVEIMRHLPKHPNIVTFREAFEDKEAVYLVMELCHGGELFDRIVAKGHYTERAAATAIKTILEIVKVCHEHGVIHRDLKPENFLLADESETAPIKAIDFGLSIFYEPDTEEGIAHAIIKGDIDFEKDPWPKVSEEAKDLVRSMLDPNPYSRMTVQEVFEHPWIQNLEHAPNVNLGENVRTRIKQFSFMSKFKKKVLRVVAGNLPNEQTDAIVQIFRMMDTDENGHLSFEELRDGLQKIGHCVADPDVQMLMDAADIDGNGTLNCEEFVTMAVHLKRMSNDEHLSQAFHHFDKNQSGYIEFEELQEALLHDDLGPNNEQVIRDIIHDVDLDKDGRISYEEFKAMMLTGMDWKMASRQYSRALLNAVSIKILKQSGQLR
ncbi:Protein kinase domain - like 10 [Theobroma cacao]|nr:Protein kinase domain - like 10 [Theobroma cacao]